MLGYIFSLFLLFSFYWAPLPWPPLCVCLFYRMVGGLAWGHILLGGRINSWVLWLIHRANSCSPSNSPLLRRPSRPRRWAARRQCLPQSSKFSVHCFNKNALSSTKPHHAELEVPIRAPLPAPLCGAFHASQGHGTCSAAPTSPNIWARFSRVACLLQSSGSAS